MQTRTKLFVSLGRKVRPFFFLLCVFNLLILPWVHFHPDNTHSHPEMVAEHHHQGHFHSHEMEALANFAYASLNDPAENAPLLPSGSSPEHDADNVELSTLTLSVGKKAPAVDGVELAILSPTTEFDLVEGAVVEAYAPIRSIPSIDLSPPLRGPPASI